MKGSDFIVEGPSCSGKTTALVIALLQAVLNIKHNEKSSLDQSPTPKVKAVILAINKQLSYQISYNLKSLGKSTLNVESMDL